MRQKFWRTVEAGALSGCNCVAKMFGVPKNDDRGQQVQPGQAIVLSFGGSVSDFALTPDAQRIFQGMMRLTLVQTDLGTALYVGVQSPVDNEQGSLDPRDLP